MFGFICHKSVNHIPLALNSSARQQGRRTYIHEDPSSYSYTTTVGPTSQGPKALVPFSGHKLHKHQVMSTGWTMSPLLVANARVVFSLTFEPLKNAYDTPWNQVGSGKSTTLSLYKNSPFSTSRDCPCREARPRFCPHPALTGGRAVGGAGGTGGMASATRVRATRDVATGCDSLGEFIHHSASRTSRRDVALVEQEELFFNHLASCCKAKKMGHGSSLKVLTLFQPFKNYIGMSVSSCAY